MLLISPQRSLNLHLFLEAAGAGRFGIRLDFPADPHKVNGNLKHSPPEQTDGFSEGDQTRFLVYLLFKPQFIPGRLKSDSKQFVLAARRLSGRFQAILFVFFFLCSELRVFCRPNHLFLCCL